MKWKTLPNMPEEFPLISICYCGLVGTEKKIKI